jgi:NhaA family Na+:H+ antiporter
MAIKEMEMTKGYLSQTFQDFFRSEKTGGLLLLVCTAASLVVANSPVAPAYLHFWHSAAGPLSIEHWVNDGLMAVFFLLIGLELERELYVGELSDPRQALLPICAAIGGMAAPAFVHLAFNAGTSMQDGFGIPMATDIAFALAVLAILGSRIPPSLKVFVVAFAVMDDLGAIILIAVFYSANLSLPYLTGALTVWALLVLLNRLRVMTLIPYLLGGALMWFFMLKSGVHATLAGVMLAFAIPFSPRDGDTMSPSHRLENMLHKPAAFIILPIFALANTGVSIDAAAMAELAGRNGLGIFAGLIFGKPAGVVLLCAIAVMFGICRLPPDLGWRHVIGAGMLGGIGFTMSIFITNLAFGQNSEAINASKLAVLFASLTAGIVGFLWLNKAGRSAERFPGTGSLPHDGG